MNFLPSHKQLRRASFIGIAIVILLLCYVGTRRPFSSVAVTHTPDTTHIHQIYGKENIAQRIISTVDSLDGVEFWIDNPTLPKATRLLLHVRDLTSSTDIRTVETSPEETLNINTGALTFRFETIKGIHNKELDLILEAPELKRSTPLRVKYQSDSTLYPVGKSYTPTEPKQGNLGFVLYERPQLATVLFRWLIHPEHRGALAGVLALVGACVFYRKKPAQKEDVAPSAWWQNAWNIISWKKIMPWIIAISIVSFAVYWPATKMFFIQDDIVKLARVKYFHNEPVKLLFTNHLYVSPGNEFATPVVFYRPVSFSLASLLLWDIAGMNPAPYHISNIILLAGIAIILFIIGILILKSYTLSFLATIIWLFHSTKVELAYWWSQNEDLIANFFFVLALLFYTRWRATRSTKTFALLLGTLTAALFSKEHAVFFPLAILVVELASSDIYKNPLRFIQSIRPAVIGTITLCGIYLIIRTFAVYDPSLPSAQGPDSSYETSISAPIAQSVLGYAAWSAENWIWPSRENLPISLQNMEGKLENFIGKAELLPPYYPGVVLILLYIALLVAHWKNLDRHRLLLLAGAWWLLMIGPQLFLLRAWNARWLSMSVWAVGLLLALLIQHLFSKRLTLRNSIAGILSVIIIGYGFFLTHYSEKPESLLELSRNTSHALELFIEQSDKVQVDSVVYFVGVPPDTRGSINAQLLRLGSDHPFAHTVYLDTLPEQLGEHDIIIDMSNVYGSENL